MNRLPKQLSIGRKAFWKGRIYTIMGCTTSVWALWDEKTDPNIVMSAPKYQVQPIVTELFQLGDTVASKFSYMGIVTGFEPEENRVVTRPAKGNKDRQRYAYKPGEVSIVTNAPVFRENALHELHLQVAEERHVVRALPHPEHAHLFTLYRESDGRIVGSVPRDTCLADLAVFNIEKVEYIGGMTNAN